MNVIPSVMKRLVLSLLALAVVVIGACQSGPSGTSGGSTGGPFMLGIDVLASRNFDLLRGKRVGLICNQTSMTGPNIAPIV